MEDWRKELGLSEELANDPTVQRYDSAAAAIKGLVDTKSQLGRSLTFPAAEASTDQINKFYATIMERVPALMLRPQDTPEGQAAFWKMAGVPDGPEGYSAKDGAPEGLVREFREHAKALNLTQSQFEKGLEAAIAADAAQTEARDTAAAADKETLTKHWGEAAEQNEAIVAELVAKYQDPDSPIEGELNAAAKLMFMRMAGEFSQGPQGGTQPFTPASVLTPGEAQQQINDILERLVNEPLSMQERRELMAKRIALQEQLTR